MVTRHRFAQGSLKFGLCMSYNSGVKPKTLNMPHKTLLIQPFLLNLSNLIIDETRTDPDAYEPLVRGQSPRPGPLSNGSRQGECPR